MKMTSSDSELLEEYAKGGAEEAFAALTRRHLDLVYSAALRQVRSPQLAEEVAQSVFTDLARNAGKLKPGTVLPAWLYQVTRRTAVDVIRRESRRQLREQVASELADMKNSSPEWTQIEPLLDQAMEALDETDRSAVLLRYFENKSLREVGETLGTSEDAARKRVGRAVERLREFLSKQGITVGASGLTTMLCANTVQSSPVGLTTTICKIGALSAKAIPHSGTLALTKTLAMTTTQKTLISATIAVALGTGIYATRRFSLLQEQAEAFQQQQGLLAEQVRQLRQERDEATDRLAVLQQENESLRRGMAAMPRLRGEVARLRSDSQGRAQVKTSGENEPDDATARAWLERVSQLKQKVAQAPEQRIPELQLLIDKDWLDAVKDVKELDTDTSIRKAISALRITARREFALMAQAALRSYSLANGGQLPADLSQVKPYFTSPVDDAVLQRYEITQTGMMTLRNSPLDDEDDVYYQISKEDLSETRGSVAENTLKQALQEFSAANNGQKPADPSQLVPYVRTPAEQAVLQRLIQNSRRR